jgi:hypothetical protein
MILNKKALLLTATLACSLSFVGCTSTSNTAHTNTTSSNAAGSNTAVVQSNTGTTHTTTNTTHTNAGATQTNTSTTTQTNTSTTTVATTSGDKIGVPECDEYIEKYEACVRSKVPESARGMMESSLAQQRKAWKDSVAASPQSKDALGKACKQAQDTAKQSMTAYGCAF